MTWQLWQQQHMQPAFPSRTFVLDKLKSGDDCWCRVSEWICKNLLTMRDFPSSQKFTLPSLSTAPGDIAGKILTCHVDLSCLWVWISCCFFFSISSTHWWSTNQYDSCVHKNSTPPPSICQGSPWNKCMIGQIALWLLFDRNELDHLFAVSVQLQLLLPKCSWWEITQISGIGLGEPNAKIYFRNCR